MKPTSSTNFYDSSPPGNEWRVVEEYEIESPFNSVQILFNENTEEYLYRVLEPDISEGTRRLIEKFTQQFLDEIRTFPKTRDERKAFIRRMVDGYIEKDSSKLSPIEKDEIFYSIYKKIEGYDKIHLPVLDESIEDISCSGPGIPIFVFHRTLGSIRSNLTFESDLVLDNFVRWLVQRSGKHISTSNPMADCTLPDGSRLQATLGREVTNRGSSFSIRRFKRIPFTPVELLQLHTLDLEMATYIWNTVQRGSNIFVIGGTASGKTTTLNSALLFVPPTKKVVSIEDTREMNIPNENWVSLVTRQGIGNLNPLSKKRSGEIDMFDLLVAGLRQRPDLIIVGEVRGQEASTVFQSMATGQTAYGTFHAEDIGALVHRLQGKPINIPRSMIASLNVVIIQAVVRIKGNIVRRIKQIIEVGGYDSLSNEISVNTVFEWSPNDDSFSYVGQSLFREDEEEIVEKREILDYAVKNKLATYEEFTSLIGSYYLNRNGLLEKIHNYKTGDGDEDSTV